MLPMEIFCKEDVESAEKFMRENVVDSNITAFMFAKFTVTRQDRRELIDDSSEQSALIITPSFVLKKYPIFVNLKEAVRYILLSVLLKYIVG